MKKEAILQLYQTYRLYIFPAIVALSSLVLIVFVIYPQTIKLFTNQKIEGEILDKSKLLAAKAQALENYNPTDLSQKVDIAISSYPVDKDFVSALGVLQNSTSQTGFSIITMSLGPASSRNSNTQAYNIKLDVLGPGSLLPVLLSNIESSYRLMRVSNIEATLGKDSKATTISLNIDVLYSSAPQTFGSVDSPLPELSQQDEEVIAKLARTVTPVNSQQITPKLGPRGKANPFE